MVSFPDEREDPESNIPIRSVAINIIEQAQSNQEPQDGAFVMTRIPRWNKNIYCLEKHLPLQNLFSRCVII
jgi:hypothetical protein